MGYGVNAGISTFEIVLAESSTVSQMNISPETVRMHRKNLYLKLEVGSQSELFALFIEWLRGH